MRLLLIAPSVGPSPSEKTVWGKLLPSLALEILRALTPDEHDVSVVNEDREDIDFDDAADLVGISTMTMAAHHAYAVADEFRKRGKMVILGGVHPSILPEEALRHADAVVIGESEGIWRDLLADASVGRLRPSYHDSHTNSIVELPIIDWAGRKRQWMEAIPVLTTRGCPYACEFCSCTQMFGTTMRHVPVERVVAQIVHSGARNIFFLDDNIIGDPPYAKQLFRALIPLGIRWAGEASLSLVRDDALMRLAAQSGCKILLFGLESVSPESLAGMKKSIKDLGRLRAAIRRVQDAGIHFHPSLIFGFDGDRKRIFSETIEFLYANRISTAGFSVLTPFPGTPLSDRLRGENRLLTSDWKYYNLRNVVYRPRHMTPLELNAGRLWTAREFQKISAILKRLPMISTDNLFAMALVYFAYNLGYRKEIKNDSRAFPEMVAELFGEELGETKLGATAAISSALADLDRISHERDRLARAPQPES